MWRVLYLEHNLQFFKVQNVNAALLSNVSIDYAEDFESQPPKSLSQTWSCVLLS